MWGKLSRLSFLAALSLSTAALAQKPADLPPRDRAAIQGVINGQMNAFRRDEDQAAFGFASPDLQTMFGSASIFMSMVRSGYQPVYRPRSYSFGDILSADGAPVQEVAVIGPDGRPRIALYSMEHQPDGSWRISGCQLLDRPTPES
jgi:hypothetical protein